MRAAAPQHQGAPPTAAPHCPPPACPAHVHTLSMSPTPQPRVRTLVHSHRLAPTDTSLGPDVAASQRARPGLGVPGVPAPPPSQEWRRAQGGAVAQNWSVGGLAWPDLQWADRWADGLAPGPRSPEGGIPASPEVPLPTRSSCPKTVFSPSAEQFQRPKRNWYWHSLMPICAPSPIAMMASGRLWQMARCRGARPGILLQMMLAPRATTDDSALRTGGDRAGERLAGPAPEGPLPRTRACSPLTSKSHEPRGRGSQKHTSRVPREAGPVAPCASDSAEQTLWAFDNHQPGAGRSCPQQYTPAPEPRLPHHGRPSSPGAHAWAGQAAQRAGGWELSPPGPAAAAAPA